jgi:hypothetical protein
MRKYNFIKEQINFIHEISRHSLHCRSGSSVEMTAEMVIVSHFEEAILATEKSASGATEFFLNHKISRRIHFPTK